MNNYQKKIERNTLLFAGVTGFSVAGGWVALFSTTQPFSIFPFIAVIMGLVILYNRYINHPMERGMGSQLLATLVLGILLYTSYFRVVNPDAGSNFVPLMLSLFFVLWLANKRRLFVTKKVSEAEEVS